MHLGTGGVVAVGVIRSIWSGAQRADTRLHSAIRLHEVPPCPAGVDPDVWLAYQGLAQVVGRQHARWSGLA